MNNNEEYNLLKRAEEAIEGTGKDKALKEAIKAHLEVMRPAIGSRTNTKYDNARLNDARPDELIFVLSASDPTAPNILRKWGDANHKNANALKEATILAEQMESWRAVNIEAPVVLVGGLTTESVEEQIKPFFSETVLAFHQIINVDGNFATDRTPLNLVFMGMQSQGELTNATLKKFAAGINKCAEEGAIEYGTLCPVTKLGLCDKKETVDMEKAVDYVPEAQMGAMVNLKASKRILNHFAPTYDQKRFMLLFYPFSRYTTEELQKRYPNLFNEEGQVPTLEA